LILVGFSQGTMVALNLALTIKEELKGVLGYSGGVILTKSGKIFLHLCMPVKKSINADKFFNYYRRRLLILQDLI